MTQPANHEFFLATAGVLPILLLVSVTGRALKFEGETRRGTTAWLFLFAAVVVGEVAALRALAWPPASTAELLLAAVGLTCAFIMPFLLFMWQIFDERTVSKNMAALFTAVALVVLAAGIAAPLLLPAL